MRLGELVWPDSVQLQSFRKVILRCSLQVTPDSYSFPLPTHKTVRAGTGNIIVVRALSPQVDPLPLFCCYLHSHDRLFYHAPELWLTATGRLPTRSWFMRRFRSAFPPDLSGHSMRAGGTTSLALSGVAPHLIQALGCWSSDEWHKYVCKHPYLQQALLHGVS